MKIKKAVIPVAGKGTRFLPATKQTPKEMIPVLTKPMIHYVVEEAVGAGIEQIVFVTSSGKESLENYFDRNLELEVFLERSGKEELQKEVKKIGEMVEIISIRQKEQLGLGHAIACAEPIVGDDPFAVLLGDDIILSERPVTRQLLECSEAKNFSTVIGVMEVPKGETFRYGIVKGDFLESDQKTLKMDSMVEKPAPEKAPSNLATPGRYILEGEIFDCLRRIKRGVGGEYQLTDALNMRCQEGDVFAHIFDGERFDTGNIHGYLNATLDFALRDPNLNESAKQIIIEKVKKYEINL